MHEYPTFVKHCIPIVGKCPCRWERCNILDRNGLLACLPKPIGKLTFVCLVNLKEKQLEKLAKGLLNHTITL
jgi:hypothetical protein